MQKLVIAKAQFNVYYRIDGLDEDIISRNPINYNNYKAIDQQYITDRFTHQLQGGYTFNKKLQLATIIGLY